MSCSDEHHHIDTDALRLKAQRAFEASGEQWTAMRDAVFTQLARHNGPTSAYKIADDLSLARGKRVAPNSIYRILDLFVEKKLAVKIESANAFLSNSHPGEQNDCIFLVCDECGSASHIDSAEVGRNLRDIAASNNFRADRPVLEIRGTCKQCWD